MTYLLHHPQLVARLSLEHLALVSTALGIAMVIAVPAGIAVARYRALTTPVYGVLGIIYTIPSLALFALLIPLLGLGFWTAVVALAAYAQMILVRNTAAALSGVDAATVEAARGMGMSQMQTLWLVERPLAMPVFIAGVRLATVSLIGIATIAAWINAGGLGTLVLDGIEHDYPDKAVAGALAAVIVAFAADYGLRRLERGARPRST
ncbi:MAG TPA: ABC transporter permease [Candidatus Eremiobacteraceae bacterium]|nr:ABC transporter permease [Candidatus Eremiobacteraceae bacterium]